MAIEIVVPDLGESVVEATVARWLKKEGEAVSTGEPLVELETDKVNLEVAAERDGVLAGIAQPEGSDVQIGDVLGTIDPDGAASQPQDGSQAADNQNGKASKDESTKDGKVTPMAKQLAQEHGVDLAQVSPGGPGERVTKKDVEQFVQQGQTPAKSQEKPQPETAPKPQAQPQPDTSGREERMRMSRRRQTIARRLLEAQHTTAMLTTFNEINMGPIMDLRKRRRDTFTERHGVRLGFMSFFVKASISALKKFPLVNAEIQETDIVMKNYYDIGIAVGAEEGLVVPVLRDADRLTFAEIEQGIADFATKAQNNSLSLDDLRGGTFTITNGGVFGSLLSTPILNPPQVAILGLHKIEERPMAVKGEVVIRPMMYVALSYDHRIIDGSDAVQFLVRIKTLMEDPEEMLLEG